MSGAEAAVTVTVQAGVASRLPRRSVTTAVTMTLFPAVTPLTVQLALPVPLGLSDTMFFSSADQETLAPSGRLLTEREAVLPNMTESSVLLSVR